MKNLMMVLVMLMGIGMFSSNVYAQTQVADEIMALAKAQWAAYMANPNDIAGQYKNASDDYTEFNPAYSTRIDGKALNMRLAEANSKDPSRRLAAEMLNAKVQVYGDVAILSYNYAGVASNKDGVVEPVRAKSTRVYAKQGGSWKLVHANFAADPMPGN
jgi:ketosteroid isomerase-like protein